MRCLKILGVMGFMLSAAAWAAAERPAQAPAGSTPAPPAVQAQARQRLAQRQAEVKRLEQDVARQESDSKQASERLQQQDQAIADLQKQLDALRAKPPARQH
jgi:septal ring factor EnvC (AmiA/AmiB activator)